MQGEQVPPQSTSVSTPFLTESAQLGARQVPSVPHTPLRQSALETQPSPVPQPGQAPPPQSTSVSVPFRAPSLHAGELHVPPAQ
jgi:hypothetical protein